MNGFDPYGVPILINVRDRLTDLRKLLGWLDAAGYGDRVVLIDNDSTWPATVDFLDECPYRVVKLRRNVGSRCVWETDIHERGDWFVYTDCDVLPVEECPNDVVAHLHELLMRHREYPKAGLGIYIRDCWDFKDRYREQLYHNVADNWLGDCHRAKVETTFALYKPGLPFTYDAVRSAYPYECRHLPFYREGNPTEEDVYYLSHARGSGTFADGSPTGGSDWARNWHATQDSHAGDLRRASADGR